MITLSIATVNFNNLCGLHKTFNSILDNINKPNVEWIIVDGGSTDGSVEFIYNISDKHKQANIKIISEKDNGIYDAMNKAIDTANGTHILFMNSGDCFNSGSLQYFFDGIRDVNTTYYGDANFYLNDVFSFHFKSNMKRSRHFLSHNCFCHQSIFYPTKLLKMLKGYRLNYKISADFDLTWRLFQLNNRFEYLPISVSNCELGGVSCLNGVQSYRDRISCFFESKSRCFALLLLLYYPIFFIKNLAVRSLEGTFILNVYRKCKLR